MARDDLLSGGSPDTLPAEHRIGVVGLAHHRRQQRAADHHQPRLVQVDVPAERHLHGAKPRSRHERRFPIADLVGVLQAPIR